MDAHNSTSRGAVQETAFRALYDFPTHVLFLVGASGRLSRTSTYPNEVEFSRNTYVTDPEVATLVIDPKTATHRDLSPSTSVSAIVGGTLRAAGFVNLTLHVLGSTSYWGARYDTRYRTVVGGP